MRKPGRRERGRKGGYYGQSLKKQERFHIRLLAWLAENSDSEDIWEGRSRELPPIASDWRNSIRNMKNKKLLKILDMSKHKHLIKIQITSEGRELLESAHV